MAIQIINIGTVVNDGTGDPMREAFGKVNDNFAECVAPYDGDPAPTLNQILKWNGSAWVPGSNSGAPLYTIAFFVGGLGNEASELLFQHTMEEDLSFAEADLFVASYIEFADTCEYQIWLNDTTEVATIVFPPAGKVPTITWLVSDPLIIAPGDDLAFWGPGTVDATGRDIRFTMGGSRI